MRNRNTTELDALQADVDALKRLQAETAVELDVFCFPFSTKLSKEIVNEILKRGRLGCT
jgi:hypothetical protein